MSGLPAAVRNVGNQSMPDMMPLDTESAGTWPGQRRIAGTRKPPSMIVPLHWANGVVPPSGQVKSSVPLSVVKTTMVLSSMPISLSFAITMPMSSSSWAMPASSSDQPFSEVRIFSFLSEKMRTSENGWSEEEAGMAQLDDDIGIVMAKLKEMGVDDNTIVVFTTDNGTEVFTWPDGGTTPFAQCKGTIMEGGFRVPAILRWPGHVPADSVCNGIMSGMDWFPTFLTAAGNPNITDQLLKGVKLGDRTYKNHLDGYDQTAMITGKGPSTRHEIFYLGESSVGAIRIDDYKYRFIDQPQGWMGEKTHVDVPYLINLRLDPFERQGWPGNLTKDGAQQYFDWFKFQFWRFVFVQQVMGKELQTFLDYPPMQRGASFNLDAVKAEMAKKMEQAQAASKGPGQ